MLAPEITVANVPEETNEEEDDGYTVEDDDYKCDNRTRDGFDVHIGNESDQ